MIYVPKVAGFSNKDLAHKNEKRLFKKTAREISSLDKLYERRAFRTALADKASDGRGIDVREMADIVAEERYNKKDRITRQEAAVVAKHFGIGARQLTKAKKRYFAHQREEEHKKGIAKPYGQRDDDDDHLTFGGSVGSDGEGSPSAPPSINIPRRPMF